MTKEEFIKHLEGQDFNFILNPDTLRADVIVTDESNNELIGYEPLPYFEVDDPVVLEPVYEIIGYKRIN